MDGDIHKTGRIQAAVVFRQRVRPETAISDSDIQELMAFKASERKDDPERLQGIHGPYEELILLKTGHMPKDYYEAGDPDPWGLRIQESRSNILWQVTSGMMDQFPEFGGAYMALALDHGLGSNEYALELGKLNKDWRRYVEHSGMFRDHVHRSMGHVYHSVSCPACSVLTAMASQNEGMISLFKEMAPLKAEDRRTFLKDRGLLPYLNMMVPVRNPAIP